MRVIHLDVPEEGAIAHRVANVPGSLQGVPDITQRVEAVNSKGIFFLLSDGRPVGPYPARFYTYTKESTDE